MVSYIFLLIAFLIAYKCSKHFRYRAKFSLFALGQLFVTLPWVPFMLFRPKDYRNVYLPALGSILVGRLFGIRFELRGLHNIDKEKGGVVLVNHQSGVDILILSYLAEHLGKFATVVKKSIIYWFPFPWLWGTIYLDRSNKQAGRSFICRESEEIRKNQTKILMYPEGTRNQGPELLPFKKGAFYIALATNCDIYPVVVSRYHFTCKNTYKFDGGRAILEVMPRISTKGMNKSNMNELMKLTWDLMQKKYEELSAETLKDK